MGKHKRHDQDACPEDERVLGLTQIKGNRSRGFGFGSEKIVSFRLKYLKWG